MFVQLPCTDMLTLSFANAVSGAFISTFKKAVLKLFGIFAFVINNGAVPVASFFNPNFLKGSKMAGTG